MAARPRQANRPMSQWNIDALVFLQGKLKENVFMSTGLSDILQTAADGFMSATEERQVKKQHGNDEQMGKLIEILKGKQDKDFKTFLKMLRKTNQGVWADELERKAEEFRQERRPDQVPIPATSAARGVTAQNTTQAAIQVLNRFRGRFIDNMDANSVVHDLLHDKIISDGDYQDITTTRGRNQQNRFLHLSLKKCTDEVFENACEIFIKSGEDGNARMKALGEQMVAALNEAKDQSLVTADPGSDVLESDVLERDVLESDVLESNVLEGDDPSGESNPRTSSTSDSSARRRGKPPKEQVTSVSKSQPKKKHQQPNDRQSRPDCCTRRHLVYALVVIGFFLVVGGVVYVFQGEAEMSAGGKPVQKQDGRSRPDSKVPASSQNNLKSNTRDLHSANAVQLLLKKYHERFIKDMDAKVIAGTLKRESVIPERIATDIERARSTKEANGVLYDHLYSQASEDGLKRLFQLCSEEEAYPRMNAFGKEMLGELEQRGGSAPGRR